MEQAVYSSIHLLPRNTGFYAGYMASAFTLGRFLSGYAWGYFTDSVGRKPTIVLGLLSMATFSLAFGLSTSYTWALSFRCVRRDLRSTYIRGVRQRKVVRWEAMFGTCHEIQIEFGITTGRTPGKHLSWGKVRALVPFSPEVPNNVKRQCILKI